MLKSLQNAGFFMINRNKDMNDDIKLMIAIAGNRRLPHLEVNIFADHELTCFYLTILCKDLYWWDPINTHLECAWAAYYYFKDVLRCRWPEAEALIASDEDYWAWYAHTLSRLNK